MAAVVVTDMESRKSSADLKSGANAAANLMRGSEEQSDKEEEESRDLLNEIITSNSNSSNSEDFDFKFHSLPKSGKKC